MEDGMKGVVLDGYTVTLEDLNWAPVEELTELTVYDRTPADKVIERIGDSEAVFINKIKMTDEIYDACADLKFVGELATGYDNANVASAKAHGVAVANVPAYATEPVAQHTMALILEITNNVGHYTEAIHGGAWVRSEDFTFIDRPLMRLKGMSLGIVGYGAIGYRVAELAEAFGMKVNIYSRDREAAVRSDILTLHCPATPENKGFINREFIDSMKDGAILINTARGALVNEKDLAEALKSGKLKAAAADVVNGEPMAADSALLGAPNLYITPHLAWSDKEARQQIIDTAAANLKSFMEGGSLNRIV